MAHPRDSTPGRGDGEAYGAVIGGSVQGFGVYGDDELGLPAASIPLDQQQRGSNLWQHHQPAFRQQQQQHSDQREQQYYDQRNSGSTVDERHAPRSASTGARDYHQIHGRSRDTYEHTERQRRDLRTGRPPTQEGFREQLRRQSTNTVALSSRGQRPPSADSVAAAGAAASRRMSTELVSPTLSSSTVVSPKAGDGELPVPHTIAMAELGEISDLLHHDTKETVLLSRKRRLLLTKTFFGDDISKTEAPPPLEKLLKNSVWNGSSKRARRTQKKSEMGDGGVTASSNKKGAAKGGSEAAMTKNDDDDEGQAYTGSDLFLKGNTSGNKHRDLLQHFVTTGQRPQNHVLNARAEDKWAGYPDRERLARLKADVVRLRATPPMHIKCDLKSFDFTSFGTKFDVIHIDPPLLEYQARAPGVKLSSPPWMWDDIRNLDITAAADKASFVFMWCGSGEGLQKGRECFTKWGFKRCEDIVWVKSNRLNPTTVRSTWDDAPLQHTTEHCLMGIRGRTQRKTDGHFVHANIDTDVIIAEEPEEYGSNRKPDDIFELIENFCLGRRRLNVFGNDHTIRPGWISIGPDLTSSLYDKEEYLKEIRGTGPATLGTEPNALQDKRWANAETKLQLTFDNKVVGTTPEIEKLRPRSPPPHHGRGGGRGASDGRGGTRGRGRR